MNLKNPTTLQLVEITPENWRQFTRLAVSEAQRCHVADNVLIMARAYVYRHQNSQVWGIQSGKQPVGLLLQRDDTFEGQRCCDLDQLMIAEPFQGQGYGRQAMRIWLDQVRLQGQYAAIILCYKRGNDAAMRFYQRLGFIHCSGQEEDEIIMKLSLESQTDQRERHP